MHSWDPLSPWFSASDKFSPTTGGAPTPATIFPLLGEDHVNNHISLGVPPPNTDTRTLCQVEVTPRTSEGIEPFTLANSPPGQVEVSSSRLINSLSGQVRVTPHKSEGIEPFTTVNSPPCQVRVTPHKSEGIEPFTTVNSPPGQVAVSSSHLINTPSGQVEDASSHMVNSPLCQVEDTPCNPGGIKPFALVNSLPGQVRATPSHPINTPSGPHEVASSVLSCVPISVFPSVSPVLPLMSSTSVLVPITDRSLPVTSPLWPLPSDPSSTSLNTMQAMSHEQPVDLPARSGRPQSAFIEEVNNEDLPVPSTGPQPIGHATIQHLNDSDIFDGPGQTSSSVPPPIEDPHEDLGASDSDNDSLPSLGDPKPKFFGEKTLPSISLIGAAAFKWIIDAGEEVYTINIQPTSDYLDIAALRAVSNQPAPMSTLHSEPLPTDEAELFAKVVPEAYQDFFDVFSREEAKNMPPHREFDHEIHIENDQTPPHSHIYPLSGTELG